MDDGAELQAALDKINAEDRATYDVPPFLANYRHPCVAARQAKVSGRAVSTAIDLKERYVVSEDGEWAIIYREGKCKGCGAVARSLRGRIVPTLARPPISGRVARD